MIGGSLRVWAVGADGLCLPEPLADHKEPLAGPRDPLAGLLEPQTGPPDFLAGPLILWMPV